MNESVPVTIIQQRDYAMVIFGCGRSYAGAADVVRPAIKRHEQSGCKGCRRYHRRLEAILRKRRQMLG